MANIPKKKELTPRELRKIARERFLAARKAEAAYQRQLSAVGRQVGSLIEGYAPAGKVQNMSGLQKALQKYADMLQPWAKAVTARMHADIQRRDAQSWIALSREMGTELRREIASAPTGRIMREAMDYQVSLITSIPLEAAQRVHKLAREAIIQSTRAGELEKEILRSGKVAVGRAKTIARTETSRTASLLLEARAQYVGSTHYIWHTSEDSVVRPAHRKLDGKVFAWDLPPDAGSRMRYNPGCGPNCRCFAEPIIAQVKSDNKKSQKAA